jgi:hypothetical protein
MKDLLYSRFRVQPNQPLSTTHNNNNYTVLTSNNTNNPSQASQQQQSQAIVQDIPDPPEEHEMADYQYDAYQDYKYYYRTPNSLLFDVQDSYRQWTERMKLPPTIIKDPLDMEFPTEILYHPELQPQLLFEEQMKMTLAQANASKIKHPQGPYLDINLLATVVNKEIFERLALEHFHVYDARFSRWSEKIVRQTIVGGEGLETEERE